MPFLWKVVQKIPFDCYWEAGRQEQQLDDEETVESTVPSEPHYVAAYLADVNYVTVKGSDGLLITFYVCERCRKAMRCLSGYVINQIQPYGFFSLRINKASSKTFEHRRGVLNILLKQASHYMDMSAIIFEEPAATPEDVQAGDERRMTHGAVD
ncbi:hypothetical protein BV898_12571 [Hypsibius exemplaris]|uniref:Uncharacterized protein n=1 Tax=Hypsibius exemplaris TaxID=2072580 RepID=A0A1W0WDG2_HYPEX|nr:hypothetical protein BV898_12571 [Hypsibius exemplaris]